MKWIITLVVMLLTIGSVSAEFLAKPTNPDCEYLGYANEFKIDENPVEGTYDDGYLYVTISNTTNNDELETILFDWSANHAVDAVIVKGGSSSNIYDYNPAEYEDFGLSAPKMKGVSHVSFCWDSHNDVPEFGTIGAIALLAGAGLFVYKKRK